MSLTDQLQPVVAGLFFRAGIDANIHAIEPANAGGNNRIYRVDSSSGVFALKHYFRHSDDQRDRLSSEFTFLRFAGQAAPNYVPKAYACDQEMGMALYEYVEGMKCGATPITWKHVEKATEFFEALNAPAFRASASELLTASEACFSIVEHLSLVGNRIDRLRKALAEPGCDDHEACRFLAELHSFWEELVSDINETASQDRPIDQPLDDLQRCVSPSDFGFHNALLQADGSVKFLDFEYAGLDDPAKMAGDFFAQLAVPVPQEFFAEFVLRCMKGIKNPSELVARAYLLRPIYRVKWCCIAMNVFLPEHMARRKFANPNLEESTLKLTQLGKAKRILNTLQKAMINGIH
jgi:hypothetical protein